jgi:hypothetical protein
MSMRTKGALVVGLAGAPLATILASQGGTQGAEKSPFSSSG